VNGTPMQLLVIKGVLTQLVCTIHWRWHLPDSVLKHHFMAHWINSLVPKKSDVVFLRVLYKFLHVTCTFVGF